jgi:hypothetical protein
MPRSTFPTSNPPARGPTVLPRTLRVFNDALLAASAPPFCAASRTFRSPGQAVSYFDGFTRLLKIRQAAEKALGPKFDVKKFHDFVLGFATALLRKAVLEGLARN